MYNPPPKLAVLYDIFFRVKLKKRRERGEGEREERREREREESGERERDEKREAIEREIMEENEINF
jgi:hypothetical protein